MYFFITFFANILISIDLIFDNNYHYDVKNALFYKEQINNDESMELLQSLTKILKNKKLENKEILSEYTELLNFLKKRYLDF